MTFFKNSYLDFGARGLAGGHYNYYTGGQEIGEYLIWDERLSDERVKMAEAYLKLKWFGEEIPGYRKANVQSLEVVSGAEVEILGDALTVTKLVCGGKVTGNLVFSGAAELEVVVAADGTIAPIEIAGNINLPQSGTLKIKGSLESLVNGVYPIVVSSTLEKGAFDVWTIETETPIRKLITLRVGNDSAQLVVADRGMTILVR